MSIRLSNRRLSEANIQAEFYMEVCKQGWRCILEYKHDRSRFDAVVVDGDEIRCIIEVKREYTNPNRKRKGPEKQLIKYSQYGVPVILLRGMDGIPHAIESIKEIMA